MQAEPPKAAPPKRKRRWYQFSLRTLMIVTVVCAIGAAWLGRKIEQKRREWEAIEAIRNLGGTVEYDYEAASGKPTGPDWLRQLFGENIFSDVDCVELSYTQATDATLERLKDFTHLKVLYLSHTEVTDAGLRQLEGLSELEDLCLIHTRVTDAGLASLKGMKQLETLWLDDTNVTEACSKELIRRCGVVQSHAENPAARVRPKESLAPAARGGR